MSVVIIMGSQKDRDHVSKIEEVFNEHNVEYIIHVASAHKSPKRVLEIIESCSKEYKKIFITVAGRSNALSGFVAANTYLPTLACPPFADKTDMMINIHSTLQMPSAVPVMTVLDPRNCAFAAMMFISGPPCVPGNIELFIFFE